ncbi:hypothetical protein C8J56DRAFT_1065395 [Mycena floridula]|nr:hypothetical protein C8J56DRAFT_1065395 [Mycena floridula]
MLHNTSASQNDNQANDSTLVVRFNTAYPFASRLLVFLALEQAGYARPTDLVACVHDANPALIAYAQQLNCLHLFDCIEASVVCHIYTDLVDCIREDPSLICPLGTTEWECNLDLLAIHIDLFASLLQHTGNLPLIRDPLTSFLLAPQPPADTYPATHRPPLSS